MPSYRYLDRQDWRNIFDMSVTPKIDDFSTLPTLILYLGIIAFGIYNAVLAKTSNSIDILLFFGLIIGFVFLITKLVLRQWKKAFSVFIAIPVCLTANLFFSRLGIDGAQLSFWTTYLYYKSQVTPGNAQRFKWGEDGIFLGGGWQNTLIFDPSDADWETYTNARPALNNALGLGYTQKINVAGENNCDMKTLKKLAVNWYFEQQYYGGGFTCE